MSACAPVPFPAFPAGGVVPSPLPLQRVPFSWPLQGFRSRSFTSCSPRQGRGAASSANGGSPRTPVHRGISETLGIGRSRSFRFPSPSSPASSEVENFIHPVSTMPSRPSAAPGAPLSVPVHQVPRKSHIKTAAPQPGVPGSEPSTQLRPRALGAIAAIWARPVRASPAGYPEGRGRGAHQGWGAGGTCSSPSQFRSLSLFQAHPAQF